MVVVEVVLPAHIELEWVRMNLGWYRVKGQRQGALRESHAPPSSNLTASHLSFVTVEGERG